MGNIVLLDDLTINKIAAGEVIERPASVVKEMVENSIDAGSKNIVIEIKNGGISFIKITDDGCGIAEDDMEIAFERHATSKIRQASDLTTVTTMGFRGEALASISAIANVEMVSKKQGEDVGHKIVVEGGKVLEKTEVGAPFGTTITVRNLFFNTPVRYKFLKKDYTESGYIEDAIRRIALVNKDVAIKLINSGKTVIQTNGNGDFKTIVYSIYGKDIANSIIEVDYNYEDINVVGVIGKPEIARANRQNQTFFVNGRFVKDKTLTSAIDQAYKDLVPGGKFGFAILNLKINPEKLDVNVHPAKLEVRFQDENAIFKSVYYAIKAGLGENEVEKNENLNYDFNYIKPEKKVEEKVIPKEDLNVEINNEMSIEERINAINSLINKITPPKNIEENKIQNNEIFKTTEEKQKPVSENMIEDIYRRGFTANKTNEEINNNFFEKENEIKIGNTKISSNTQEVEIIKNIDEEPEKIESEEENKLEKNEPIIENNNELENIKEIEKTENKEDNVSQSQDEFVEKVTDILLKEKLNQENDTEIIDTNKVREAVKETPEITSDFEEMYKKTFGVDLSANKKEDTEIDNLQVEEKIDVSEAEYVTDVNESLFEESEEYKQINYKLVGMAFESYIIIEMKNELYLIDQKSARERILYEKLKDDYFDGNSENNSQYLLLPDIVTLDTKQMSIARENIEMFEKSGFAFEEFGNNTIKIVSVPSICENFNTKQLFIEVLNKLDTVAVTEIQEKEEKFISTLASKITDELKPNLEIEEVEEFMNELLKLKNPFTNSNGKSLAIKMSKYDLDRKFNRC